ncbi:hypothetical protein [Streptomyces sp. NPDC088762]|uniref:hypothetical protein n=1 Tax=Streptomyces sp. NPDC088762 TaxID=3365891 RepID=UPI003827EF0B
MKRAVVGGVVVAVAAGVLLAGCGGGGSGGNAASPPPPVPSAVQESTPDASASVFLGRGADASAPKIEVPTSRVGEPAGEDVAVVNPSSDAVTVKNLAATTDTGETSIVEDACTGVELPPGGSCRIRLRHIATEPGPYTGELTATTSDGNVLSVGISGEALAGTTPADEDPTGTEEPSPSSTPDGYTASETPEPVPTDSY